jgi:hypothetical protein
VFSAPLRSAGKSFRTPAVTSWKRCSGSGKPLRWCVPRSRKVTPAGKLVAERLVHHLRDEDLSSVTGRADAGGSVHVEPEVLAGLPRRPSRMNPNSDTHAGSTRPSRPRERALSDARRRYGLGTAAEHSGDFVPESGVDDSACSTASERSRRCSCTAFGYSSRSVWRSVVDPSMSVKRKVTVSLDRSGMSSSRH